MPRYRAKEHQIVRCITLLVAMAQAKRGIQLRPFYAKRGWNTRCAYRDLDLLRHDAKVPVEQPERGWYRVPASWLPATSSNITGGEVAALAMVGRLAPALRDTPVGRALRELGAKLGAPSAQGMLDLEPTALRSRATPTIDYAPHRAAIDTVCGAIDRQRALRITYRDARGEDTTRTIEPGCVHYEPTTEALYVIAWCRLRAAVRTFAIHRIASVEGIDARCAHRDRIAAEMGKALRLWTRPDTQHVVLRFSSAVAVEVRERRWHASQRARDTRDGGLVLELDIAAPEELERPLLGYGADVEVLAPESLARRLDERHAAAIRTPRLGMLSARRARGTESEPEDANVLGPPTRVTG